MSGLLPNAWHVARREYVTRVRGRAFIISTLFLMILAAAVVLVPTGLSALGVDDPPAIDVAVEADELATDPVLVLRAVLGTTGDGADPTGMPSESTAVVERTEDPAASAERVRDGEIDGLLTVTRRPDGELAFDYLTDESLSGRTRIFVEQAATLIAQQDRLRRAGVAPQDQGALFAPAAFTAAAADPDARNEVDVGPALLAAWAIVIVTFIAIVTYGQWVAQSVAEEKSNRVMELLVTAATPRQMLAGKVFGTSAAGLTQYAGVVVAVVGAFVLSGPLAALLGVESGEGPPLPPIAPSTGLAFSALFLGGFLLYSTLYAAAGSMVSRLEEVQQAAGPLLVVAMAGYFGSFAALNVPDADWVAWMSYVPFFAPYIMPARLLLTSVSPLEVLLALGLLALAIAASIWVAARIYSAGVLLYGQRAGIRQVWRAARIAR